MTHFVFDKLREASLSPRVSKLEAALTYIERETGSPLKAPAAACELAHNVASEALKRN